MQLSVLGPRRRRRLRGTCGRPRHDCVLGQRGASCMFVAATRTALVSVSAHAFTVAAAHLHSRRYRLSDLSWRAAGTARRPLWTHILLSLHSALLGFDRQEVAQMCHMLRERMWCGTLTGVAHTSTCDSRANRSIWKHCEVRVWCSGRRCVNRRSCTCAWFSGPRERQQCCRARRGPWLRV